VTSCTSIIEQGMLSAPVGPSYAELEAGIINTRNAEDNRRGLRLILKEVRIWPFDWPIVRAFGKLSSRAEASGRALSLTDLVLAAMAIERNAVILSTDRDFSAFAEVTIENWL
jgi:tRNA(fMet)-specific endonuclease VapC